MATSRMTRTWRPYRTITYPRKIPGKKNCGSGVAPLMISARNGASTISSRIGFQFCFTTGPMSTRPHFLWRPRVADAPQGRPRPEYGGFKALTASVHLLVADALAVGSPAREGGVGGSTRSGPVVEAVGAAGRSAERPAGGPGRPAAVAPVRRWPGRAGRGTTCHARGRLSPLRLDSACIWIMMSLRVVADVVDSRNRPRPGRRPGGWSWPAAVYAAGRTACALRMSERATDEVRPLEWVEPPGSMAHDRPRAGPVSACA